MILGIVGSRTFDPLVSKRCSDIVHYAVNLLGPQDIVMSGGAKHGADYFAKYWAQKLRRRYIEAPANPVLGVPGLFARNTTIVMVSDKILSVWDGVSHGTLDTMTKANGAGCPLWVVQL